MTKTATRRRDNQTFSRAVHTARCYLDAGRFAPAFYEPNDHSLLAADNLELERYVRAVAERGSKAAWDALSACVAGVVASGEPIPPSARPFVAAVLTGRVAAPRSKGGRESTKQRDELFGRAVDYVCERHGLTPMRDSTRALACCVEGGSGVDAAGVAMRQLFNEHKTYMGWTHALRRYRRFSAIATPLSTESVLLLR